MCRFESTCSNNAKFKAAMERVRNKKSSYYKVGHANETESGVWCKELNKLMAGDEDVDHRVSRTEFWKFWVTKLMVY